MENKSGNHNIAFCIGDLQAGKMLLQGLCQKLEENAINLHIFNGCTSFYENEPHNIGQTNIYNLPNYDLLEMLIVAPFYLSDSEETIRHTIENALAKNVPVLTIGKQYDYENCYCIIPDYRAQIELLTSHLIEKHGMKKLNYMGGAKGNRVSEDRLLGYKDALEKHGIPFDESRVYYGEMWSEPTKRETERMMKEGKLDCDGIVCANDSMASAVITKLNELGFNMPGDIAITGMDGLEEAGGYITTAKILAEGAGRKAGEIATDLLKNGKKPPVLSIIPPNIMYGMSCGCKTADETNALSVIQRHEVFDELYHTRQFSIRTSMLVQELANCNTFEEASRNISKTLSKIWCDNSWICICKDFMTGTIENDSIDDMNDSCPVHRNDYCDTMRCIARFYDKKPQEPTEFPTSQMLPDFYKVSDKSKIILYSPIHIRDNTLGYLAFNFYPWSNTNYLLNFVTMAVSQLLEAVRRQNELYLYAQKIDMLYVTDPLTTLYNRRGFFRLYNDYMEEQEKKNCMVISIDLDSLKLINDNFGHNEGDNAITTISNALKEAADKDDICARFGGDEFVVFGIGKSEYDMDKYIKSVSAYLDDYNKRSGKPYNVHASFGGCIMPKDTTLHIDHFINAADSKMYVDKESHKRTRTLCNNR